MSAYWIICKNVPQGVLFNDGPWIEHATPLGMFHVNRWDENYAVKLSVFGEWVIQLFGEEFAGFFPQGDDSLEQLKPLMPKIPALLERIPAVVDEVTRSDHRHKVILLAFLSDLGPTLRRIQQEAPTGDGWAIVAD